MGLKIKQVVFLLSPSQIFSQDHSLSVLRIISTDAVFFRLHIQNIWSLLVSTYSENIRLTSAFLFIFVFQKKNGPFLIPVFYI